MNWKQNQSQTISFIRLPLAIAVLFIHMNPQVVGWGQMGSLSALECVSNVLRILFSHVLPKIAVPVFFVMSGLLFFRGMTDWNWNVYVDKLKRRALSLLVPYLLWNVLGWGLEVARIVAGSFISSHTVNVEALSKLSFSWSLFWNHFVWDRSVNVFGMSTFSSGPIDLPLWFLRDLIVLVVLSPLVFLFVRRLGIIGASVLGLLYLLGFGQVLSGFGISSFFFFSLGALFAVKQWNLVAFCRGILPFTLPVALLAMLVAVYYDGTRLLFSPLNFYVFPAVFVAFALASILVERGVAIPSCISSGDVFFVYASHGINLMLLFTPLSGAIGLMGLLLMKDSVLGGLISYFVAPFFACLLCVGINHLLVRLFGSRWVGYLVGGR